MYLAFLRRKGLKSRSLARHMAALRGFYAYLLEKGLIMDDPTGILENPKLPRLLPRVLSVDEAETIIQQPDINSKLGDRDRARPVGS